MDMYERVQNELHILSEWEMIGCESQVLNEVKQCV